LFEDLVFFEFGDELVGVVVVFVGEESGDIGSGVFFVAACDFLPDSSQGAGVVEFEEEFSDVFGFFGSVAVELHDWFRGFSVYIVDRLSLLESVRAFWTPAERLFINGSWYMGICE